MVGRHGPVIRGTVAKAARDLPRALLALADRLEPIVAREFLAAVQAVRDQINLDVLAAALTAGDVDEAVLATHLATLERVLGTRLPAPIRAAFAQAGALAAEVLDARLGGVGVSFSLANTQAVEYAEREVGRRITEVARETVAAVRQVIAHSVGARIGNPREVARRIQAALGLRADQLAAVERSRARWLADGVDAVTAEQRATRYAQRLLRERSQTIARFETMDALNFGAMESWRQAIEHGWLDPEGLRLEWLATDDDRVDQDCLDLDGVTVAWGEEFAPGVTRPPLHVACRCVLAARPQTVEELQAARSEPVERSHAPVVRQAAAEGVTMRYKTAPIQGVDRAKREIEFFLTVDEIDRQDERVLPSGATYRLPVPLCDRHDSTAVLGHVHAIVPTRLPSGDAALMGRAHFLPVGLNARADEVYAMIQHGSLDAVSIGFRPLAIDPGPPVTHTAWELLEVSVVPIGACAQCRITGKAHRADEIDLEQIPADAVPFARAEVEAVVRRAVQDALVWARVAETGELP